MSSLYMAIPRWLYRWLYTYSIVNIKNYIIFCQKRTQSIIFKLFIIIQVSSVSIMLDTVVNSKANIGQVYYLIAQCTVIHHVCVQYTIYNVHCKIDT